MKKFLFFLFSSIMMLSTTSCEQQIARRVGGTVNITVPKGQKVMMATWKGDDLFYMTEPMEDGYVPTTKTLHESSVVGVLESTVNFNESR